MSAFVLQRRTGAGSGFGAVLPAHAYDPAQQMNLTLDGTPLIDSIDMFGPTYTHNSDGHKQDDA